jgi:hypothetical protein
MAARLRNCRGQYAKKTNNVKIKKFERIAIEHNYVTDNSVQSGDSAEVFSDQNLTQHWKIGRRIIELGVLLENLKFCKSCRLEPVPLTLYSVQKEIKKGLGGYLYVQCQNLNCGFINCVPYGKTHRGKSGKSGMPCFAVNSKLGTGIKLTHILFL